MPTQNELLRDAAIRHAVYLDRYGKGTARKIAALLNEADPEIAEAIEKRLATKSGPVTLRNQQILLTELRAINKAVYERVGAGLEADLGELAQYEAEYQANQVQSVIDRAGLNFSAGLVPAAVLADLVTNSPIDGHLLKSWVDRMGSNRMKRMEPIIRKSVAANLTPREIAKKLIADPQFNISRQSAQTLALTANSTIANRVRVETYRQNPRVIKQVQWLATLDSRTSTVCKSRDGRVWALDEDHPTPPAHPRCRSVLLPITKSWQEMGIDREDISPGTRASMNGQVAGKTTYGDWIEKQPAHVQDAALGKARADLVRAGDVEFRDLFKPDDTYWSLDELRRRESIPDVPDAAPAKPKPPTEFSPINPDITNETIKVQPKKAITKTLDQRFAANAADGRYDPRPEFRGSKPTDFGKAQLASLTDETASMMEALMTEADAIADAFNIPRIRAIKTGTGSWGAKMGDGTLHINHVIFNGYSGQIGTRVSPVAKLAAEKDALALKLKGMREEIDAIKAKIGTLSGAEKDAAILKYMDMADAFNAIRKEWMALDKKLLKARSTDKAAEIKEASTWQPGDDANARPYTSGGYFSDPLDRARSTVYHEMAHHVHQMTGKNGQRRSVATPPVERHLKVLFANKFNRLGEGFHAKQRVATKYGTTDPFEWFAENFALYMMKRYDLVEPEVRELIERLLKEANE